MWVSTNEKRRNHSYFETTKSNPPAALIIEIMAPDRPTDKEWKEVQLKAENKYTLALMNIVSNKMDTITQTSDNKSFDLGEAERKILMDINNTGLLQGAAAGLIAFVGLRLVRRHLFGRLILNQTGSLVKSTTTNASSPITAPSSPFRQKMNPLERAANSPFWWTLAWVTDLSASFMAAVTVSFLYTDRDKILSTISEIPLVEGQSKVSQLFCTDVQEALAQMQREASSPEEKAALSKPQTPFLAAWIAFSNNCRLRQAQEQLIRRQQGFSPDAMVNIPPPGVSKLDNDSLSDDDDGLLSALDPSSGLDDFYFPGDDEDSGNDFADTMIDSSESSDVNQKKEYSRRR